MAEETKFQFDISYHQIMFLGPGLGYINQIELLAKGLLLESLNSPGCY